MSVSRLVGALGMGVVLASAVHCGVAPESIFTEPLSGPCETVYRELCGQPCASDHDCADGLHCGSDQRCTAECASGHACQSGTCSARGRCTGLSSDDAGALDGAATDAVCADIDVQLTKAIPKVLFLLDQSSSMHHYNFPSGDSQGCNPSCRWSVLKDVLIGPPAQPGGLVKKLEGEAEIAVKLYSATDADPNDGDNSFLTGPTDEVCPRFNGRAFDGLTFKLDAYADVEAMLRPATVDDDTPTGPAIRTVVGLRPDGGVGDTKGFAAVKTNAPKVLVLVTDGEPAVCGENYASEEGRTAVIEAVKETFAHGIRTFVIAIGDAATGPHFNAVANAGQGLDPATGNAQAIRPDTPDELVSALEKIVLDARTCVFELNGQVQPGMEALGTVTLNGAPVPYDAKGDEGWHLVDPSRIELVGSACETLKTTPDAQLTARFPCGAIANVPK